MLGVEEPPELGLGEDAGVVDDGPLLGRLPTGGVEGSEPGQEVPSPDKVWRMGSTKWVS